jgi:hypothetical protein
MGQVMEQLGIADAMAKKVILKPALERRLTSPIAAATLFETMAAYE